MPPCRSRSLAAIAALAISAAFASDPARAEEPCDGAKAQTLVGKAAPTDAEVASLTGARSVRRVAPGMPVTQDHRPDRITIEISDGKVAIARCG